MAIKHLLDLDHLEQETYQTIICLYGLYCLSRFKRIDSYCSQLAQSISKFPSFLTYSASMLRFHQLLPSFTILFPFSLFFFPFIYSLSICTFRNRLPVFQLLYFSAVLRSEAILTYQPVLFLSLNLSFRIVNPFFSSSINFKCVY
jgi:hypothetical protein